MLHSMTVLYAHMQKPHSLRGRNFCCLFSCPKREFPNTVKKLNKDKNCYKANTMENVPFAFNSEH